MKDKLPEISKVKLPSEIYEEFIMKDMRKAMILNNPQWCPNKETCGVLGQSQNLICIGLMKYPEPHDNDFNTHRFCIDERETGHGIHDLQINWSDAWNMIRLLNLTNN